jgi:hypothetical protein
MEMLSFIFSLICSDEATWVWIQEFCSISLDLFAAIEPPS